MAGDMVATLYALPFKKRKAPCLDWDAWSGPEHRRPVLPTLTQIMSGHSLNLFDGVPAKPVCAILRVVVCACARLCGWREVSTQSFLRQCVIGQAQIHPLFPAVALFKFVQFFQNVFLRPASVRGTTPLP